MKILYLAYSDDLRYLVGVGKKIQAQIRCLNELGLEAGGRVLYLTSTVSEEAVEQFRPEIKFSRMPVPAVTFDDAEANQFVGRTHREGFELPDIV